MDCNRKITAFLIVAMALLAGSWGASPAAAQKVKSVILATTTSTQDTGLLDVLIPIFEKKTGFMVKTIAVGSGQAMAWAGRAKPTCCWSIHPTTRRPS